METTLVGKETGTPERLMVSSKIVTETPIAAILTALGIDVSAVTLLKHPQDPNELIGLRYDILVVKGGAEPKVFRNVKIVLRTVRERTKVPVILSGKGKVLLRGADWRVIGGKLTGSRRKQRKPPGSVDECKISAADSIILYG